MGLIFIYTMQHLHPALSPVYLVLPHPHTIHFLFLFLELMYANASKYKYVYAYFSPLFTEKGNLLATLGCTWLFSLDLPSGFFPPVPRGILPPLFSSRLFQHANAIVYLARPLLMAISVVSITSNAIVSGHAQMSSHTCGRLIALIAPSLYLFSYPCPLTLDFAASLAKEAQCISLALKPGLHHLTCLADLMQTET